MNLILKIDKSDWKKYVYNPIQFKELPLFELEFPKKITLDINNDLWKPIDDEERTQLEKSGLGFLYDIGVVSMVKNKMGFSNRYLPNLNIKSRFSIDQTISILLGVLAEGLVLRKCHYSKTTNKKWFSLAARDISGADDFDDNYIAVGTSLPLTKRNLHIRAYYNPSSKRDLIWITKNMFLEVLIKPSQPMTIFSLPIGIQLKTSSQTEGQYINSLISEKNNKLWYEYPIVYFDLGGDFQKTMDRFYNLSKEIPHKYDYCFVRGKNIDPEIHDQLLDYKAILKKIFDRKVNLENLDTETLTLLNNAFSLISLSNWQKRTSDIILEIPQ